MEENTQLAKQDSGLPSRSMNCSTARNDETRSEKTLLSDNFITDGFGNYWHSHCPKCGKQTMEVLRPGDARCPLCD